MKIWISLLALSVTATFTARGATVIEGMVKMPPAKSGAAAAGRYQQKSGEVSAPQPPTAIVYLEGSFKSDPRPAEATVEIMQKSFQFSPNLLPVQTGTLVKFPNLDDDYHHVFSYSKTKEFDLGRYRKTEKPTAVAFNKPGVVRVGCEIHDHMRATILVLDTPHFKRTEPDGKYRLTLTNVPPGQYVLKAWVNEKTIWEQPVELKDGETLTVNFPRS